MDDMARDHGALSADSSVSGQDSVKVHGTLFLGPVAGFIGFVAMVITYPPLDDTLIWWVAGIPCVISYTLTNSPGEKRRQGRTPDLSFPSRHGWRSAAHLFLRFCF